MRALAFLLALCLAGPAFAGDIDPAGVMALLGQAPASTATFTETHTLAMLDAPVISKGTLAWKSPAHVEKTTLSPTPESLVVEGDDVTLTQGGQTRHLSLSSTPVLGALVGAVTGALSGDLVLLTRYYTVTSTGDAQHWTLLLLPKDTDVQRLVQYVRITGSQAKVQRVETLEAGGDRSDLAITPQ